MRFGWVITGLLVAVAVEAAEPEFALPPFAVEKGTTYFLGPLRKDGTIDYVVAINDRLSEGVTRENNAAAPLMEALTADGVTQVKHYAQLRAKLGMAAAGKEAGA